MPPEHAPKLSAEPAGTREHCTVCTAEVTSDAEMVQLWVVPGPKACPSGPVTDNEGAVLSIVIVDELELMLPAASYAAALMAAEPSATIAVLNGVE